MTATDATTPAEELGRLVVDRLRSDGRTARLFELIDEDLRIRADVVERVAEVVVDLVGDQADDVVSAALGRDDLFEHAP